MQRYSVASDCRSAPGKPILRASKKGEPPAADQGENMTSSKLSSRLIRRSRDTLLLGAVILGATVWGATAQPPQPAASPAPAFPPTATLNSGYPGVGPGDQALRGQQNLPNGKKLWLLPATLETTQWGWFDSAVPPVLRVHSGDTIE